MIDPESNSLAFTADKKESEHSDSQNPLSSSSNSADTQNSQNTENSQNAQNGHDSQNASEVSPLVRACQLGDFRQVNQLISSGETSATETAPDGVTPLHWAAINNRLNICRYLLDQGASVDAKGGGIQGTPLHWACRSGLVYIAHLLISRGADPLRTDSQGFNALHLAVHSSNVLLVIYLLHLEMPIDPVDNGDRTPLHWAAYQGDALTVDALLNWGADTKPTDEKGFTPLHWAIVKGSKPTIKRLVDGGSDVFALSVHGKSPRVIAEEMNTIGVWRAALKETGRDPMTGALLPQLVSLKQAKLIMFFAPYVLVFLILETLSSSLPIFITLPISLMLIFATLKTLGRFILPVISYGSHAIMQTPIFAGLFSGSSFWLLAHYFLHIAGSSFASYPFTNFIFLVIFSVIAYSYFACMFTDPGYIPPIGNVPKQRSMIEGLIEAGEYDTRHFCISTYVRKPLRSRYDRIAKRVVAKYDHYCPWVYNVVGIRNHRLFLVFVLSLAVGIPIYAVIFFKYAAAKNLFDSNDKLLPDQCTNNGLFGGALCHAFFVDYYGTLLTLWIMGNGVWVIFLSFVQIVQVAKGMTTNEASNLHKYGYMGGDDFSSLPTDHSSAINRANANHECSSHSHGFGHSCSSKSHGGNFVTGKFRTILRLLGLDQFIATAKDATSINLRSRSRNGRSSSSANPADLGAIRNCTDFWFPRGSYNLLRILPEGSASFAGNPVDYYRMWDFPMRENSEMNAVVTRKEAEENDTRSRSGVMGDRLDMENGHGLRDGLLANGPDGDSNGADSYEMVAKQV